MSISPIVAISMRPALNLTDDISCHHRSNRILCLSYPRQALGCHGRVSQGLTMVRTILERFFTHPLILD